MKKVLIVLAVLAMGALTAQQADAAFRIRVTDGASFFSTDEGSGDLTPGTVGLLTSSFSTANWTVVVTIGTANPLIGTVDSAQMDIAITAIPRSAAAVANPVRIDITNTGQSIGGTDPYTMTANATGGLIPGLGTGFQTVQGFYDNTAGGTNEFSVPGTVSTPLIVGSGNSSVTFPGTSPFSFDLRTILNVTAFATGMGFSVDNMLTVTNPAPPGIVLLLSGVPFFAGARWFRRRKSA